MRTGWRILLVLGAALAVAVPAAAGAAAPPAPFDWWPVPSPDGTHVAFTRIVSGRATHMSLDVLDLRTKKLVTVGTNAGQLDPTWSGDSSQLAFSSGGVLRVVRADGTAKHRYVAPLKAFAPAWRPNSTQLAYLETHGSQNTDLWVAGALWAKDVIGRPAWSPDGSAIAFQRDNGIFVATGPGIETQLASIANPGPPAWSQDGKSIAYGVTSVVFTVPADGSAPPKGVGNALAAVAGVSWRGDGAGLAVAYLRGVSLLRFAGPGAGGQGKPVARSSGPGVAYLAGTNTLLLSASVRGCGGRVGIAELAGTTLRQLTACQAAAK
jgi:Tol biopolymer transport system component